MRILSPPFLGFRPIFLAPNRLTVLIKIQFGQFRGLNEAIQHQKTKTGAGTVPHLAPRLAFSATGLGDLGQVGEKTPESVLFRPLQQFRRVNHGVGARTLRFALGHPERNILARGLAVEKNRGQPAQDLKTALACFGSGIFIFPDLDKGLEGRFFEEVCQRREMMTMRDEAPAATTECVQIILLYP